MLINDCFVVFGLLSFGFFKVIKVLDFILLMIVIVLVWGVLR